jgi:glycosyltransferase involved in cell wall biosynthesis
MASLKYPPLNGGAENQAHLLAQALVRRGTPTRVLSVQFDGLPAYAEIDGLPVVRLAYGGPLPLVGRLPNTALLLSKVIVSIVAARSSFDILHTHIGNPFSAAAILGARLAGRPSIIKVAASGKWSDFLSMRSGKYGVLGRLTWPALMLADRLIVLNAESETELRAAVGPERVTRIPNGLVPSDVHWDASDVHPGYVFAAGRLDKQKGFDVLVEACAANGPQVIIAGEGPEHNALKGLAESNGCRLRLLGQVEHAAMRGWLLGASVVAAPSRAEGMSNIVLEALALGCPIVASRVPGNVDLIHHGVSGLLVSPEDPSALRAAIDRLLCDAPMTRELGHGAAAQAEMNFSIDAVAARYADLYRELCDD